MKERTWWVPGMLPLDGRVRWRKCSSCGRWVLASAEVGLLIAADPEPAGQGAAAKALLQGREVYRLHGSATLAWLRIEPAIRRLVASGECPGELRLAHACRPLRLQDPQDPSGLAPGARKGVAQPSTMVPPY